MRLATLHTPVGTCAARIEGDRAYPFAERDVRALLESGDDARLRSRTAASSFPVEEIAFSPIVLEPRKIFCVGFNYLEHLHEMGQEPPSHPSVFAKFARALIGAYDPIAMPAESEQIDWEVELGVVIGRAVRRATAASARDAIVGYTVCNDVSVRDWQFRTRQALQGKTWEHMTPAGPVLVTPDEVDAGALRVRTLVNGSVMQDSTTADLQFSPEELVAYISTFVTLEPGDLILTGSPAGVGFSRSPKVFLREGDVLTTRIDGIGECVNTCVAESQWRPATPVSNRSLPQPR